MAILHDFAPSIHGFTVDCDGEHTIVLNARDSHERNKEAYAHEKKHIDEWDSRSPLSCAEIERKRHNG